MLIKKVSYPPPSADGDPECHTNMSSKGRRRPQAPRAQPQGQGLQVPPHSHRVACPPSCPLLQDRRRPAPHLEVRERHCQHHRRLSDELLASGGPDSGPRRTFQRRKNYGGHGVGVRKLHFRQRSLLLLVVTTIMIVRDFVEMKAKRFSAPQFNNAALKLTYAYGYLSRVTCMLGAPFDPPFERLSDGHLPTSPPVWSMLQLIAALLLLISLRPPRLYSLMCRRT